MGESASATVAYIRKRVSERTTTKPKASGTAGTTSPTIVEGIVEANFAQAGAPAHEFVGPVSSAQEVKSQRANTATDAAIIEQLAFFPVQLVDAALKSDMASMEHPFFSLAKRRDLKIRHYEHNGNSVTITPSVNGMATIWDKDVLLYTASALSDAINRGGTVSRTIRIHAHDLLRYTGRGTGKRSYDNLQAAFERLTGTRIKTDITTGGTRKREGFGLIERWKIVQRQSSTRMDSIEIQLSDWFYDSVIHSEVLTMNRAYFSLTGGLERRLYEIARKFVGRQPKFAISLSNLYKKSGSNTTLRDFRRNIREIAVANPLPDYIIEYDHARGNVIFRPRVTTIEA